MKEELVKTTEAIISRTKISKVKYFCELYSCLLIQIYDKSQQSMGKYNIHLNIFSRLIVHYT